MHEIDQMDIAFYMRLVVYEQQKKQQSKMAYIDQLGIF